MRIQKTYIIYLVFPFFYFFLLTFLGKDFVLWPQIIELQGSDPLAVLTAFKSNAIRYLLTYPIFFFSSLFTIDLVFLFTIFGIFMITLSSYFLSRIVNLFLRSDLGLIDLLSLTFMGSLMFFANGRMIYAFLGTTILIYALLKCKIFMLDKRYFSLASLMLIGNLLTHVSSGTSTIAMTLTLTSLFFCLLDKQTFKPSLFFLVSLVTATYPLFLVYLDKNLAFYGYSLINMLDHGVGQYIVFTFETKILSIVLALFLLLVIVKSFKGLARYDKALVLTVFFLESLFIGLFGFNAMWPTFFIALYVFLFITLNGFLKVSKDFAMSNK
tara:strand:- start:157 stop:1134 length:978 start_codon:yes stop_codon:yes gene_type:complete